MRFIYLLILFLIINFTGLAFGAWLMDNGPQSSWYISLNQAPWTPPGWVFGVAWTTIMICFSVFLAYLFKSNKSVKWKLVYTIQVFLNVIWNYIFFNQHLTGLGLLIISLLTVVIFYFFFGIETERHKKTRFLLLPYLIWLGIAVSLNAYIFINN